MTIAKELIQQHQAPAHVKAECFKLHTRRIHHLDRHCVEYRFKDGSGIEIYPSGLFIECSSIKQVINDE